MNEDGQDKKQGPRLNETDNKKAQLINSLNDEMQENIEELHNNISTAITSNQV